MNRVALPFSLTAFAYGPFWRVSIYSRVLVRLPIVCGFCIVLDGTD